MSTHIDEQIDDWEAGELSVEFEGQEPWDVLEWAIDRFGGRLAISTAFQEGDVALIDMAYKIDPEVRVFSMDTGRLPQETFDLIEQLRDRYEGLRLELISPDAQQVQRLVDRHGPNLFFKSVENRLLCCNVRKVQPLTPLAEWQEDEVWEYLRENDVPTHALYEKGYTSIGCAPCTKPVAKGQPVRAGRWWWETDAPKECGMHCAIETGGFEHELHAILGEGSHE
jgi:phosphoadenosine phosphosulfate reductase